MICSYGRDACVNYTPTQGKLTHLNLQLDLHGAPKYATLKHYLTSLEVMKVAFPVNKRRCTEAKLRTLEDQGQRV